VTLFLSFRRKSRSLINQGVPTRDCHSGLAPLSTSSTHSLQRLGQVLDLCVPPCQSVAFNTLTPYFAGVLALISHLLWYWGSPPGERPFEPCVEAILTMNSVTGGQRRRGQPRRPHRSLRAYRELLQAPRVLYRRAANGCHDRHNCEDHDRGIERLRNRDKGNKTGSSKCVTNGDI
jgi:hypothetical protein